MFGGDGMYLTFNQIIDGLEDLNLQQKEFIIQILQEKLNSKPVKLKTISSLEEIRENRFNNGLYCIHCGSKLVRRFGKYHDRQRFQCKACNRTFNDLTKTPMHKTKHLDKWGKYLEYMIEGYSIRKCAKLLKIHVSTSFAWRHKILHVLNQNKDDKLQGIVEADETYELFSAKGSRTLNRKPRKRGGVAKKRGISQEQVCILVARDRTKTTVSQLATMGRINSRTLEQILNPKMSPGIIFCSDGETPFKAFCRKNKFLHQVISSHDKRTKDGLYHIQNVNAFHSRYKDWEARFHGIASKYTDNYLAWFDFLDHTTKLEARKRTNQLLLDSTGHLMKLNGSNFQKYYDLLLLDLCA